MEDLQKCVGCKRTEPKVSFNYGCLTCDKCMDYKRAWNKKRSDEIHKLYSKTYCHLCKFMARDVNWENHLQSKRHQVSLSKLNK